MKVKILKQTYISKALFPNEEVEVNEETGRRLIRNKIAEPVEFVETETVNTEVETEEAAAEKEVSAKELFERCKELGIEMDKSKIKGKSEEEKKEYLLSLLQKVEVVEEGE